MMTKIILFPEIIQELADKKFPHRLWGCIQERNKKIVFRVGEITKEFKTINNLKDYLKSND